MVANKEPLPRTVVDLSTLLLSLLIVFFPLQTKISLASYFAASAVWLLVGYQSKRPWLSFTICGLITSALLIFVFHAPKLSLLFFPLWVLIGWLCRNLGWWKNVCYAVNCIAAHRQAEALRLVILGASGAWSIHPYLTASLVGSGDGAWYASVLADYITQLRAGIFPVWIGQTYFAFMGATFPLRYAPYFQHLAGAIDIVTFHKMGMFALQNATIALSALAGLYSCYFSLTGVLKKSRWFAVPLSFLYITCPGVLAIIYGQDMIMSFMTLPYPPIVFGGIVRSFRENDFKARLMIIGGLAMTWLGHAPIGLWTTALAGLTQIIRLRVRWTTWGDLWKEIATALAFSILASYPFVSVSSLGLTLNAPTNFGAILHYVDEAFPASLLPLSATCTKLSDLQFGYGLFVVLFGCIFYALQTKHKGALMYVSLGCLLLFLLLPIPVITEFLWSHIPGIILTITDKWPMQRLYVDLALLTVFSAAWLLSDCQKILVNHRLYISSVLLLACIWSGFECNKMILRGKYITHPLESSIVLYRSENLPLTKSALSKDFVNPRYFSHGVMDPEMESRILAKNKWHIISSNIEFLAPGYGPAPAGKKPGESLSEVFVSKEDPNPGILNLEPAFKLDPSKHYLLIIEFFPRMYKGVLQILGDDFFREYLLPQSGFELSFGSNRTNSRAIPLWTTSGHTVEVKLRFIPTGSN